MIRRGRCSASHCCSRWAGFAVQPNGVTGFAIRIIMYWNETAWMAIKNKLLRYTIDDGKTRHTKPLNLHGERTRQGERKVPRTFRQRARQRAEERNTILLCLLIYIFRCKVYGPRVDDHVAERRPNGGQVP